MNFWQGFADFSRLDRLSGGPDSHMATISHLAKDLSPEERAWWGCVYVAVYNVPQALVILHEFPTLHIAGLRTWIIEHWPYIVLRRERRRPVGSPTKLADCLESAARWISIDRMASAISYEDTWRASDEIKYFGRYARIKVNEVHRRLGLVPYIISDLRAKGGWSPREGLALLWPEHEAILNGGDGLHTLAMVEQIATATQEKLATEYGVVLDNYELQVFCCDVKQSIVGQRQYPGRSLDSELTHYHKVAEHFSINDQMFQAREKLFPFWSLAEKQGWNGVREDLGECFAQYGYMWTDSKWDYRKTTDFAQPVAR